MEQKTIIKNSPIIDILGSMSRVFNNCPFDDEIRFIHDGTIYTFLLMDDMTWTLKRRKQNTNRYDVKYGEITDRPDINGLIPKYIERHFNGWDGSVSYEYSFDVETDGYTFGNWDFKLTIPREIATITL